MSTYYTETHTLRETQSGARCVAYRWFKDFGRDSSYARSWGCREEHGAGVVWLKPGEELRDAMRRKREQYSEV